MGEARVQVGNILYFFFILLLATLSTGAFFLGKRFGKEFSWKMVLALAWTNFVLHFVKQFNPSYIAEFPRSLTSSTLPNLCAVLIFFSPIIMVNYKRWRLGPYLMDYLVVIGCISGLGVFLYPTTAIHTNINMSEGFLEVLRFYFCHGILFLNSFLIMTLKLYHVDYKRTFMMPFIFLAVMTTVFVNDMFFYWVGLYYPPGGLEMIFYRDDFNPAFVYGPPTSFDHKFAFLYNLIPSFWKSVDANGIYTFTPVVWVIGPLFVIALPVFYLLLMAFDHKNVKHDVWVLKQKILMRRIERACRA